MADVVELKIQEILKQCNADEKRALFTALRATHQIHELETTFSAPAETILEAIHRAPELTRRMLRGVIADAAFAQFVVPELGADGWKDVTPVGNFLFDHLLDDGSGPVSVQVKLQRSLGGQVVITKGGKRSKFEGGMYTVEPQKTRGGTKKGKKKTEQDAKTRPYRFGDFDIIAVSLQPSTRDWKRFRYTLGNWLLPEKEDRNAIAVTQPVPMQPNDDWTDDFNEAAAWFRSGEKKTIGTHPSTRLI